MAPVAVPALSLSQVAGPGPASTGPHTTRMPNIGTGGDGPGRMRDSTKQAGSLTDRGMRRMGSDLSMKGWETTPVDEGIGERQPRNVPTGKGGIFPLAPGQQVLAASLPAGDKVK